MAVDNILQLRQVLREKFPGLRMDLHSVAEPPSLWPTGLANLDQWLGGGLPKGVLTEIVSAGVAGGSASLLGQLIRRAAAQRQYVVLVDAMDSFDPCGFLSAELERLLWLRCHGAEEALKASDIVFRDGNLPVILLDLALVPEAQLRKIPAPAWYRFQRIVEEHDSVAVVVAPRSIVSPAAVRVTLPPSFDIRGLDLEDGQWASHIDGEGFELGRSSGVAAWRKTA